MMNLDKAIKDAYYEDELINVTRFVKSDITENINNALITIYLPDGTISKKFIFYWFSLENPIEVGKKVKFRDDISDKNILKGFNVNVDTDYTVAKIELVYKRLKVPVFFYETIK